MTVALADTEMQPIPLPARQDRPTGYIAVDFACLLCSRTVATVVCATLPLYGAVRIQRPGGVPEDVSPEQLRFLRCTSCGGSVLPIEVTRHELRSEKPIDWSELQPRRGRPPKSAAAPVSGINPV
jgi:hypothetical protein